MKRVHIFVSGRVQGVNFRYYTEEKARELEIVGWVKNLDDGRVEIVAEGEEGKLKELVEFCKEGPSGARVGRAEGRWEKFEGEFKEFGRRY